MIHFFRRIRQKLLAENRLTRYLIYAIGEIVLVVIGILVALAINNWNEDRKDRAAEIVLLDNLLNEFESNQERFGKIYHYKKKTKENWKNYLPLISNPNGSIENRSLNRPNNGSQEYPSSNSVLSSILTSGTLDIITNDSLKHLISGWNEHLNAYKEIEKRHVNLVENSLRQYETKHRIIKVYSGPDFSFDNPFYNNRTDKENSQRMIQMNEDPEYQNLLLLNYMWIELTLQRSEVLDQRFEEIITALKNELKSKN